MRLHDLAFLDDDRVDSVRRLVEQFGERTRDDRAQYRRQPEKPELTDRCAPREEGGARAPRRVHGGVRDRDRNEMDEHEGKSDRDPGKTCRRAL